MRERNVSIKAQFAVSITLVIAILQVLIFGDTKYHSIEFNAKGIRGNRVNSTERSIQNTGEESKSITMEDINNTYTPNISIQREGREVLGSKSNINDIACKFKVLIGRKNKKSASKEFCNIPDIKGIYSETYPNIYEKNIYLKGSFTPSILVQVDEYRCRKQIYNPASWFRCKEEFLQSNIIKVRPNMYNYIYMGADIIPTIQYIQNERSFEISARYFSQVEELLLYNVVYFRIYNFNIYERVDREYPLSPKERIVKTALNSQKPFIFPFTKIVGVTQWHGNTVFQKPHTGIDFGSYRESTVAVEDGTVVGKGYDLYYGECNSGGNYLTIKHPNGIHTTYFHLHESYVNQGDTVKKGDVIAKTGNSGSWNCQSLQDHLHFETRLNRYQNSHVDPVKYIDTDWDKVPTIGASKYPGRLSGDNPHPGR